MSEAGTSGLPVNQIIQGDCIDVMKILPPYSVNLIMTSPPYALGLEYEKGLTLDKLGLLIKGMLNEAHRVLHHSGRVVIVFGDLILKRIPVAPYYYHWIEGTGLQFESGKVWIKPFARLDYNFSMANRMLPFPEWEHIWTLCKGYPKLSPSEKALRGIIFTENRADGVNKSVHPSAYPISLVEQIISIYTQIGDVVLDPFLGSGTTAVACLKLRRKFIGIEINSEYCAIARKRVEPWLNQSRLGEVDVFG